LLYKDAMLLICLSVCDEARAHCAFFYSACAPYHVAENLPETPFSSSRKKNKQDRKAKRDKDKGKKKKDKFKKEPRGAPPAPMPEPTKSAHKPAANDVDEVRTSFFVSFYRCI
jgi:hypothetical protein